MKGLVYAVSFRISLARTSSRRVAYLPSFLLQAVLFTTALSSALTLIVNPALVDPYLIWPYVALAIASFLCAVALPILFSDLNKVRSPLFPFPPPNSLTDSILFLPSPSVHRLHQHRSNGGTRAAQQHQGGRAQRGEVRPFRRAGSHRPARQEQQSLNPFASFVFSSSSSYGFLLSRFFRFGSGF